MTEHVAKLVPRLWNATGTGPHRDIASLSWIFCASNILKSLIYKGTTCLSSRISSPENWIGENTGLGLGTGHRREEFPCVLMVLMYCVFPGWVRQPQSR